MRGPVSPTQGEDRYGIPPGKGRGKYHQLHTRRNLSGCLEKFYVWGFRDRALSDGVKGPHPGVHTYFGTEDNSSGEVPRGDQRPLERNENWGVRTVTIVKGQQRSGTTK